MPQIVLEEVTKTYGSAEALKAVSYAFEDGRTTAVIGPSGSGKSTLLQCINGLVRPESGEVRVFGESIDYRALPALRLKIGYAVQGTGLFPHMTVWDNITLLGRLSGWSDPEIRKRGDGLMGLVGLEPELGGRYPHEISGGQQQRVGLCRAMFLKPDVFLLDEAFGALDPITRDEIHQEFLKLQKSEPRTIVLVTHDMREAMKLGQQVVILNEGRIVQAGTPGEIQAKPADDFVGRLLKL